MLYNGQKIKTPKYVIELAREQRIHLTDSEQLVWSKLRNKQVHGFRFRCQHPVYRYIIDFYCHKAMLAVEIDGDVHKYRKEYDNYRDEFLNSIGITTLRFPSNEVFRNIEYVVNQIKVILLK
jgi:very-short-patch-repair endonuclease